MNEPRYVDDPFEDSEWSPFGVPVWRQPKTQKQRRLLQALGMKYWPLGKDSKQMRHEFIVAEKAMQPVSTIVPEWPEEWFENCLNWLQGMRRARAMVSLKGFMTLFLDADARERYRGKLSPKQRPADEEYR